MRILIPFFPFNEFMESHSIYFSTSSCIINSIKDKQIRSLNFFLKEDFIERSLNSCDKIFSLELKVPSNNDGRSRDHLFHFLPAQRTPNYPNISEEKVSAKCRTKQFLDSAILKMLAILAQVQKFSGRIGGPYPAETEFRLSGGA